jgi:hypothetical protein
MRTPDRQLDYSYRFYEALLSCYPARFRMRFSGEMAQVFRDCCERERHRRAFRPLFALWLRTLRDFLVSVVHEWQREITLPDSEIDYPGLADLFMITVVVGTNLLVWGWTAATVTLRLETWSSAAIGLTGIVTFVFAAAIGVFCAKLVAHPRHPEQLRIKG